MSLPVLHVCIATGQNAANLIPLEQYDARDVWILQTPAMRQSAANLEMALRREGRTVLRIDFDDSSPATMTQAATAIAERLDGRHVVLHVTGGTKLMVLALRDGLRYVEAGVRHSNRWPHAKTATDRVQPPPSARTVPR